MVTEESETHRSSSFGGGRVAGRPIKLPVLRQEAAGLLQEGRHVQLVPLHHLLTFILIAKIRNRISKST